MRRYGSLKYGSTQYGFGTVEVGLVLGSYAFTESFRKVPVKPIFLKDQVIFSDRIDPDHLLLTYVRDQIIFQDDYRLKYVRVTYSDSYSFRTVTNVSGLADKVQFDERIYANLVYTIHMANQISFSESLHARRNWEPVPNPADEIWTPRPHDGDIWVPRTSPVDFWTPREQNNG